MVSLGKTLCASTTLLSVLFAGIAVANAQIPSPACVYAQTHMFSIGSHGTVVSRLQKLLNTSGAHIPTTGYFGPLTQKKLSYVCTAQTTSSVASSTTPVPAVPLLSIVAGAQPAQTVVPANTSGVPFINVTFIAGNQDVTIRTITVEMTGPASANALQSIALNDPSGLQVGDIQPSFSSQGIATLRQPFVIPANTSQTYSIVGNMPGDLSSFVGQVPTLQIDSVSASMAASGSFPIKGTAQTLINSITIGGATATVSPFDPFVSTSQYVNSKGVRFSGIHITANSQEDLTLSYLIWRQSGTIDANDLANVMTVVNGTSTSTIIRDRDYISIFNPPVVIKRGNSIDAYVQGDLNPSGALRTVKFDIYDNTDDIGLTGNTYGFGDGIVPGGNTAISGNSVFITSDGTSNGNTGTPFYAGSITTISPGGINVR